MLDGKQYTKQQAAVETGLSVATCNTLLNDMQMQGSVSGEKRQLGEVGRSSVLYRIKKEHESYLYGEDVEDLRKGYMEVQKEVALLVGKFAKL